MEDGCLQILRLAENTGKTLSSPFKVPQIPRDRERHCRWKVLDALVPQEGEEIGIRRRVENDLRRRMDS